MAATSEQQQQQEPMPAAVALVEDEEEDELLLPPKRNRSVIDNCGGLVFCDPYAKHKKQHQHHKNVNLSHESDSKERGMIVESQLSETASLEEDEDHCTLSTASTTPAGVKMGTTTTAVPRSIGGSMEAEAEDEDEIEATEGKALVDFNQQKPDDEIQDEISKEDPASTTKPLLAPPPPPSPPKRMSISDNKRRRSISISKSAVAVPVNLKRAGSALLLFLILLFGIFSSFSSIHHKKYHHQQQQQQLRLQQQQQLRLQQQELHLQEQQEELVAPSTRFRWKGKQLLRHKLMANNQEEISRKRRSRRIGHVLKPIVHQVNDQVQNWMDKAKDWRQNKTIKIVHGWKNLMKNRPMIRRKKTNMLDAKN